MSDIHLQQYNHDLFAPIESATSGSDEAREEVIDGDAGDLHNPPHYMLANGQQSMDFIQATLSPAEFRGFLRGNALKYLIRYDRKGTPEQDVAKALDYVTRLKDVVGG